MSVNQIQIDSESEKQSNPPITTACHDARQAEIYSGKQIGVELTKDKDYG